MLFDSNGRLLQAQQSSAREVHVQDAFDTLTAITVD